VTENWEKAVDGYTKCIALDPKDVGAYYFRGKSCQNAGRYQQAINDFTEAIGLDPDSHTLWYERAETHAKNGDADKAISDYKRAIELNPEYEDNLVDKGFAWLNVGVNRLSQWWKDSTSEKR
jgi:tetratricopeptide (TPR) repeat protein